MDNDIKMCEICSDSCGRFFRRMDKAVDLRVAPTTLKLKKSHIDLSPGMMNNRLNLVMGDRRREKK